MALGETICSATLAKLQPYIGRVWAEVDNEVLDLVMSSGLVVRWLEPDTEVAPEVNNLRINIHVENGLIYRYSEG
jgi:hypothetical protein